MNTQPQVSVSDMVLDSVSDSIATVKSMLGLKTTTEVLPFMKVVIACRSLNGDAHEQVVKPIVAGILEQVELNPVENAADREKAVEYAELIALSISDATQLIYQEMQRQVQERAQASGQIPLGS